MGSHDSLKSVTDLTVLDLDEHPVWEFTIDLEGDPEIDETFVRPVPVGVLPSQFVQLIVAADFVASNGSEFEGFVDATVSSRATIFDGMVIYRNQHADAGGSLRDLAQLTGEEASDLAPLTFQLRVKIEGESEYRRGTLA